MDEMEKAISNGDLVKLKEIIDKGADINQKLGHHSFSAVHLAVRHLQPDILRFLLEEKKMDPDAKDEGGFSPLWDLCSDIRNDRDENKVLKCFQILKDANANLNIENNNSWRMSCIEKAVFDGDITMIKVLVDSGVNLQLDTVKIEGKNANLIHLAIEKSNHYRSRNGENSLEIIKLLISKMGADSINDLMGEKYTALDIADEKFDGSLMNGEKTSDSEFFQYIISYLEEIGGERNVVKFSDIPIEQMIKIDNDLTQEEIKLFKRFASVMSIAEHVISQLIKGKKEGAVTSEYYIRMAAYAYKEISDLITYLNENFSEGKLRWEKFNAVQANILIERMIDPRGSLHQMDEKTLSDIRHDVSDFLTRLNVYSRYE